MKAVIFDLDGVLVSTDTYHYRAWKELADSCGIYFDEKINNRLRGVSRAESLEIILEKHTGAPFSDTEKKHMLDFKNEIYVRYLQEMKPADVADEVRDTLSRLHEDHIKLAVGSSSKNTKFILERTALADMFDAVSDGTNITRSKPDPEVFLKAAAFVGTVPEECLVVEDAVSGINAAHAGKMKAAGIGEAARYKGTDYPIQHISELTGIMNDLRSGNSRR